MRFLIVLISAGLLLLPLVSCTPTKMTPKIIEVKGVSFSIDKNGIPVAKDAKGNLLKLNKVDFPIEKVTKIENIVHTPHFTIVEAKGSHFVVVGPPFYAYYFPHPQ